MSTVSAVFDKECNASHGAIAFERIDHGPALMMEKEPREAALYTLHDNCAISGSWRGDTAWTPNHHTST